MTDEGLCRVGWATDKATLNLGTDRFGFGFGGTGKKSFNKQFDDFGEVCHIKLNIFRFIYIFCGVQTHLLFIGICLASNCHVGITQNIYFMF